jgi:hypothetical protein
LRRFHASFEVKMRRRRSEDDSRFLVIPFFTAEIFSLAQAGREAGIHFSFAELAALAQAGWPAGVGTKKTNSNNINSNNSKKSMLLAMSLILLILAISGVNFAISKDDMAPSSP